MSRELPHVAEYPIYTVQRSKPYQRDGTQDAPSADAVLIPEAHPYG